MVKSMLVVDVMILGTILIVILIVIQRVWSENVLIRGLCEIWALPESFAPPRDQMTPVGLKCPPVTKINALLSQHTLLLYIRSSECFFFIYYSPVLRFFGLS